MPNAATHNNYEISMENIRSMPPTSYFGTKILFVISGSLTVNCTARDYKLQAHDILILNRNVRHEMSSQEDNIVIVLSLTAQYFAQHDKSYFSYHFDCFSREMDRGREQMVALLRRYLAEIMIAYSRTGELPNLELQSSLFQTMLLLTRFFKTEAPMREGSSHDDERIMRIIQEIEQRYDEPITLHEIAQKEYLSVSYLSRYFKKMTGFGFVQYVNLVRLKHSLDDLLHSTDSLSHIALKHGFASSKNFNAVFKSAYGMSPAKYRKEHLERQDDAQPAANHASEPRTVLQSPDILAKLAQYIETGEQISDISEAVFEKRQIELDPTRQEEVAASTHVLFIGQLKELLNENVKEQLLMAKKELRIRYIGIRNLIFGKTLLPEVETDELVATSTPFMNSDLALQFLQDHHLHLLIRIEYQEISSDENKYFELLDKFIRHSIHIFGRDTVAKWRFLYYEPHVTIASPEELRRIYLRLQSLVKSREERVQVGTYLPFSERTGTTTAPHEWQVSHGGVIDFLAYEANPNEVVDFDKSADDDFTETQDYILSVTTKLKAFLRKHRMEKPLFLMSWNTLTGNTRYTNGTFFRGALVMRAVLDLSREVNAIGFWINTEQHEEERSARNISIDGLELFHFFNGKRPAYYAVMFKERLRGRIVAQGKDYVMTEHADGYQLALLNCNNFNPRFSVEELFLRQRKKEMHIRLLGMKPGAYQIRKFQFDRDHGALYSEWGKLNSKHGVDQEIMNYVIHRSIPSLKVIDEQVSEDWSFYVYLDMNAIHFYEFRRMFDAML